MDLTFQDFAGELASLPGKYTASDGGCLLLAKDAASLEAFGVVALRGSVDRVRNPGACEMKRLYVTPAGRGTGVGRKLIEAVIAAAERLGYWSMLLDTLPHMEEAIELYKTLGFETWERFYENPYQEALFMRKLLKPNGPSGSGKESHSLVSDSS